MHDSPSPRQVGATGLRLPLARLLALGSGCFWALLFFGLVDFLTPFVEGEDFAAHYVLETGWGLLFLVLVSAPLLVLAVRPKSSALVGLVLAAAAALVIGGVLSGSSGHALVGCAVAACGLVVAWLARTALAGSVGGVDVPLLILTCIAAVPAAVYAQQMATATLDPEETWGLDHYPVQAALALAIVLGAAVLSIGAHTAARSRLAAWLVAFSAGWLGIESVVYADRLGSVGSWWGIAATVWGGAVVVAMERARHKRPRVISRE